MQAAGRHSLVHLSVRTGDLGSVFACRYYLFWWPLTSRIGGISGRPLAEWKSSPRASEDRVAADQFLGDIEDTHNLQWGKSFLDARDASRKYINSAVDLRVYDNLLPNVRRSANGVDHLIETSRLSNTEAQEAPVRSNPGPGRHGSVVHSVHDHGNRQSGKAVTITLTFDEPQTEMRGSRTPVAKSESCHLGNAEAVVT